MKIALIAAVARNGVIGFRNALPWHLPEDLKRFKAVTLGHPVLMGRKTFESLGRPLSHRRNLVMSRHPQWGAEGIEVYASLRAAVASCKHAEILFVIGGSEVYRQALPLAELLYLTEIDLAPEGDAFFVDINLHDWQEVSREDKVDPIHGLSYHFVEYHRIRDASGLGTVSISS